MKKKKQQPQIDEEWMTTYSDMVTLLLTFFVMMLALSSPDPAKFEKVRAGMTEAMSNKEITRPIEMLLVELTDDIQSLQDEDKPVSIGTDSRGIVMDFEDTIFFDRGSARIKPEAEPILKKIAATLTSQRYRNFQYSIEGHTSNEKFSSAQFHTNWELSSARASAVVSFLESRGVPRIRLMAIGMADISPKYPNLDMFGEPIPQNRQRNNRISIRIEPTFR